MKYIFLINTFSLKDKTNYMIDKIEEASNKFGFKYIIETNNEKRSTEDILDSYKNKKETIIVIGGDGVINRALNKLINTKNTLGFIPFGTGNDFNRYAKEEFKDGINQCDVIKINNKYFINIACFGIDAEIANNSDIIHSKFIPKSQRYNASIVANFIKFKAKKFTVSVNKEKYENNFSTIVVGNARYYGGGYKISPEGIVNDGKMELYLVDKLSRLNVALLLGKIKKGKHTNNKHLKLIKTNKLKIACEKEITANIDGEELIGKTFNLELIPKAINIYYDKRLIKFLTK